MGGVYILAGGASLWSGQAELVSVLFAAGYAPVGDVAAAGIVVVGVVAHCNCKNGEIPICL